MKLAIWHECYHEGGAYVDYCYDCAPFWVEWPYCPDCRVRLKRNAKPGKGMHMGCPQCGKRVRVDQPHEVVPTQPREGGAS